ncbi:hypothetical protein [Ochrobactrum sp. BTU2]|uniref:hypothetical protein n=1 Tax=Ochrobactrum sp. BTU2 TaxID=2856166 RepID=UPI00211A39F0|nr:hypothetical protein [Ochrobactrum sp. BTU2]MCQ9147869.1 hypothetical protein [Ochrobactrum sp. BTU2]
MRYGGGLDLCGKRGLVVSVANETPIAVGCATAFRAVGVDLTITYLDERAAPFTDRSDCLQARLEKPLSYSDIFPGDLDFTAASPLPVS